MSVVPRVQHVSLAVAGAAPASNNKVPGKANASRVIRAIVMPRQELDRIKAHSQWLAEQARDAQQRAAQARSMKEASESLVKNWKNTVLNKQRERLERRQKRIQDEEDRKNAIYQASVREAAEERKKKIEEVRRMLLFEKDDIHLVNSAFVFSEVLHERSKQVEFNEHLKQLEEKAKQAKADQIKRDVEVYHDEEEKRKEREHAAKMERKAENIKMMKEKAEREAFLLSGEKAFEKQDLAEMEKEMKQVEENIQREIQRKKSLVRKDALESIEMNKEKIKMQKQEDEDEEKVIQIYLRVKQRMECLRKKREQEARQAKHEHQERIRAVIAESLKEKEDDIDGMIAKALKEREEREAAIVRKKKDYEARLLKERKDYHAEVEEQKKKDKIEDKELRQWILMQGLKRDEIDKLHEIKRKESAWASKMTVRDAYNNQIEEHRDIKNKLCMQDQDRYNKLVSQMEKEDADFFDYANEVLNECKVGGRPLYPIQKTIHEYRKKHGIINRERYEKWAKEMAEQERRYREEDEDYNRQLSIIDEPTPTCKPLFPPLLKKCPL